MAAPPPHHSQPRWVLQLTIVSAEDLAPVSKNMKTYAIASVNPDDDKLVTGVDQTGGTDPIWKDKFMFHVDDKFLNSEDAAVLVEIYAAAWVKDVLIGHVNVLLRDLFHLRSSAADAKINNSATRTVTLQIRRPSGRPQGILNMEVALRDSSKPEELTKQKTVTKNREEMNQDNGAVNNETENYKISRCRSERTDLSTDDNGERRPGGSIINGGECSEVKGNGSMVNGDSLCCSDVGPSASVVAAAIAKGLYTPPVQTQAPTAETRQIREWTRKERNESLDMKLERWRSDIPPQAAAAAAAPGGTSKNWDRKPSKARSSRRSRSEGGGGTVKLFSCFSNSFGCEISITCGGSKKKHGNPTNNKICHLSSVDENYSQF